MKDTEEKKVAESGKKVPVSFIKRLKAHLLKRIIKGLAILLLLAMVLYFVKVIVVQVAQMFALLPVVSKIGPKWQGLIFVGILLIIAYVLATILEGSDDAKNLASKTPIIKSIYFFAKIKGAKPCIVILQLPSGEVFLRAIYLGKQSIRILGEHPRTISTGRVAFPTFPIPLTGYAEGVSEENILIVTNVSLTEWLSNIAVALTQEILPSIDSLPLKEFLAQNYARNHNHSHKTKNHNTTQ